MKKKKVTKAAKKAVVESAGYLVCTSNNPHDHKTGFNTATEAEAAFVTLLDDGFTEGFVFKLIPDGKIRMTQKIERVK
jgi:hypothetical protein